MKLIGPQTLQHCLSFAFCPSSKNWMQKAHCSTTAVIALSLSGFEPLSLIHTKRMIQKIFAAQQIYSLTDSSEGEVSEIAVADLQPRSR